MAQSIFSGQTARSAANIGAQVLAQRIFAPTDREIISPLRDPGITSGLRSFQSQGFTSPGLTGTFSNDSFNLSRNPLFQNTLSGLGNAFQTNADFIRSDLLPQVEPGVGGLTQARLGEIENRRRRSIGNLRENLARRRVLGSSFATDAIARADAEFAKEAAEAKAQGFLQELDLKTKLTERAFDLERQKFQTELNQLNLESELAANVAQTATKSEAALALALSEALSSLATQQASLLGQSAQGTGEFLGRLFGQGGEGTQLVDSLFGGNGTAAQSAAAGLGGPSVPGSDFAPGGNASISGPGGGSIFGGTEAAGAGLGVGAAQFAGTGGFALPGGGVLAGQGSLGLTGSGAPALTSTLPAGTTATGAGAGAGGGAGAGAGAGFGAAIGTAGAVAIPALMLAGIKGMRDRSKARDKAESIFQQGVSQAPPVTINGATGRAVEFQGRTFLAQPGSFLVLDPQSGTLNQIDFLKGVAGPITSLAALANNTTGPSALANPADAVRSAYRSFGIEPPQSEVNRLVSRLRKKREERRRIQQEERGN